MGRIIMSGFIPKLIIPSSDSTATGIPVTITGTGNPHDAYVTINNTQYTTANTLTVNNGNIISFSVYGQSVDNLGIITIDGEQMARANNGNTETYSWTVPDNITSISIHISASSNRKGTITVTTT